MIKRVFFWVACVVLIAGFPHITPERFVGLAILGLFYGYLGIAWNILAGYGGLFSFGHAMFVGIGAYTSTYLFSEFGVTPWVGMFVGAGLAVLAGYGVGFLCFRYGVKGAFFALAMLAVAEIFRLLAMAITAVGGASGMHIIWSGPNPLLFQFDGRAWYFYIIAAMTIISLWVSRKVLHSRTGYYLLAIREDEDAAQTLGVDGYRYKMRAMLISVFLSSLGGTFLAQYLFFIDPGIVFGATMSIDICTRAIVGGMGTVFGPLLGSMFIEIMAEGARDIFGDLPGLNLVIYGLLLIIIILKYPAGLISVAQRLGSWIRGKGYKGFQENLTSAIITEE